MVTPFRQWLPLHKVLVAYCLLTILISFLPAIRVSPVAFYIPKVIVIVYVLAYKYLKEQFPELVIKYLNAIIGAGFLAFFYNETAQLNDAFLAPVDPYLVSLEESIFGNQPSLVFSEVAGSLLMTELMNLGYLSYYFIIASFLIISIHKLPYESERYLFICCQSFIIYYLIFIFIPSVGPQYYFPESVNKPAEGIFFQKAIAFIQFLGEAPTGAMPSSHVGITVIICILAYRKLRGFLYAVLPLTVLLVISTVYIKAHYVVDVIAGILSAPVILLVSAVLWKKLNHLSETTAHDSHNL